MLGMMVIGASKFDAAAGSGGSENLLAVRPNQPRSAGAHAVQKAEGRLVAEPGLRGVFVCVQGVFWMFVIALCSALAGVYTEFLLKKLSYSTDFQNMLLYCECSNAWLLG